MIPVSFGLFDLSILRLAATFPSLLRKAHRDQVLKIDLPL
jgi:hypothetical protein